MFQTFPVPHHILCHAGELHRLAVANATLRSYNHLSSSKYEGERVGSEAAVSPLSLHPQSSGAGQGVMGHKLRGQGSIKQQPQQHLHEQLPVSARVISAPSPSRPSPLPNSRLRRPGMFMSDDDESG
jgi:hypothetical protein